MPDLHGERVPLADLYAEAKQRGDSTITRWHFHDGMPVVMSLEVVPQEGRRLSGENARGVADQVSA